MIKLKRFRPWAAHVVALASLACVLLSVPAKVRAVVNGTCPVSPSGGYDANGSASCEGPNDPNDWRSPLY